MMLKFTRVGGRPVYGAGAWALPAGDTPGLWMPKVSPLVPCESGYHLITSWQEAMGWISEELYEAEGRGVSVEKSAGVVVYEEARLVRRLQWDERIARLFAADCAERVAHLDPTGTAARTIEAARRYARGKATDSELTAARDAAWDAAWAAAWAARDAAGAARDAAGAARDAAGDAAGDAARDAARDAAWAAAWDVERAWQADRLRAYALGEVA